MICIASFFFSSSHYHLHCYLLLLIISRPSSLSHACHGREGHAQRHVQLRSARGGVQDRRLLTLIAGTWVLVASPRGYGSAMSP
eukprot:766001-Hanusia_phi.AAC.2